jgi:hypothetical protein
MTFEVSRPTPQERVWLGILVLALSALAWIAVSSIRNNLVHAIGKLGFSVHEYGSVNVRSLIVAILWSICGFFFVVLMQRMEKEFKSRSLLRWLLAISLIVFLATLALVFLDGWFSRSMVLGLIFECLELTVSFWATWLIFFKKKRLGLLSVFLSAGSLCLCGLVLLNSFALMIIPGVSFR